MLLSIGQGRLANRSLSLCCSSGDSTEPMWVLTISNSGSNLLTSLHISDNVRLPFGKKRVVKNVSKDCRQLAVNSLSSLRVFMRMFRISRFSRIFSGLELSFAKKSSLKNLRISGVRFSLAVKAISLATNSSNN